MVRSPQARPCGRDRSPGGSKGARTVAPQPFPEYISLKIVEVFKIVKTTHHMYCIFRERSPAPALDPVRRGFAVDGINGNYWRREPFAGAGDVLGTFTAGEQAIVADAVSLQRGSSRRHIVWVTSAGGPTSRFERLEPVLGFGWNSCAEQCTL
jgi:hypothetical protein